MHNPYGQFIMLCWIIFIVSWMLFAFRDGTKQQPWLRRIQPFLIWIAIVVVFGYALGSLPFGKIILWHATPTAGIIADLTALAGLAMLIWARAILGNNWSGNAAIKENHRLITSGPYGFIRHPMYSGLFLLGLGTVIASGQVGGCILLILFSFFFRLRSLQEETMMIQQFPDAYPAYKKRTKAFIPFVW